MAWIAILTSGIFLFFLQRWNHNRSTSLSQLDLKPNCLLTRYPFLFIGGKESLFYHGKYWNSLPNLLIQHGYEVFTFDLPLRSSRIRENELKSTFQFLEKEKKIFHLVIDSSSLTEVQQLMRKVDFESIASITCLRSDFKLKSQRSPDDMKAPRIPVEEIIIQNPRKPPLPWRLHRFFIQDADKTPFSLFTQDSQQLRERILERAVELAERDFSQTERQHYEQS